MTRSITLSSAEFYVDGPTVECYIGHPDEDILDRLDAVAPMADVTRGLVGRGVARCRPEDHFDLDIGRQIAAARAQVDLARKIEEATIAAVRTEADYRMTEALNEFVDAFERLIELSR